MKYWETSCRQITKKQMYTTHRVFFFQLTHTTNESYKKINKLVGILEIFMQMYCIFGMLYYNMLLLHKIQKIKMAGTSREISSAIDENHDEY